MDTEDDIFMRLKRPFPTSSISWRVGATNAKFAQDGEEVKGVPLAYIDARDVMDRLDDVAGPANWQDTYSVFGSKTICRLAIRVNGEWIAKEDGAGDTDMEAEKGAISDALKRAAVRWGIGRYLYDLKSGRIVLGKKGDKWLGINDDAKSKLDKLHDDYVQSMEWGDRPDRYSYRLLVAALTRLDTPLLEEWEAANEANIKHLPVAMRTNLMEKINHIGAASARKEAAE
jgi:hypothetical protein